MDMLTNKNGELTKTGKTYHKIIRVNSAIYNSGKRDFDKGIMQKDDIEEAIDYLDWHFEADDGTADKDAQKAWYIIKNYITQNSKNMDGIKE